jgi:hypothetical protein
MNKRNNGVDERYVDVMGLTLYAYGPNSQRVQIYFLSKPSSL